MTGKQDETRNDDTRQGGTAEADPSVNDDDGYTGEFITPDTPPDDPGEGGTGDAADAETATATADDETKTGEIDADGDPDKRNAGKKVEQLGYEVANISREIGELKEGLGKLIESAAKPEAKTAEGKAERKAEQTELADDLDERFKGLDEAMAALGEDDGEIAEVGQIRKLIQPVLDSMKELASKRGSNAGADEFMQELQEARREIAQLKAPQEERAYWEKYGDQLQEQYPNLDVESMKSLWKEAQGEMQRFKIPTDDQQARNEYWSEKLSKANERAEKPKTKAADKPKASPKVSRPDASTEGTEITKSGASASVPAETTDQDEDGTVWANKSLGIPRFVS